MKLTLNRLGWFASAVGLALFLASASAELTRIVGAVAVTFWASSYLVSHGKVEEELEQK